jgi:hypothetical protein
MRQSYSPGGEIEMLIVDADGVPPFERVIQLILQFGRSVPPALGRSQDSDTRRRHLGASHNPEVTNLTPRPGEPYPPRFSRRLG